jgi:hypothetical protein
VLRQRPVEPQERDVARAVVGDRDPALDRAARRRRTAVGAVEQREVQPDRGGGRGRVVGVGADRVGHDVGAGGDDPGPDEEPAADDLPGGAPDAHDRARRHVVLPPRHGGEA